MEKILKKNLMISFVALMVSISLVSAGFAQQKPVAPQPVAASQPADTQARLEKFSGVIEKVDPATKEFIAQFHKGTMTFSVGEKTKFMEGSIKLTFSDLKKGDWASIEYQREGTKLVANMVKIWWSM